MSIITSFSMFFLSFLPLWISILFIDIRSIYIGSQFLCTEIISITLILIALIISLVVLMSAVNPQNTTGAEVYTIEDAKGEKSITAEFLLSYILPLFAFDFTVWHEVALFLIFFIVFMFLCIRHSHFSVNILLELMNYRFYNCKLKNDDNIIINKIVLTQKVLSANKKDKMIIRAINNEYSVQVEK